MLVKLQIAMRVYKLIVSIEIDKHVSNVLYARFGSELKPGICET